LTHISDPFYTTKPEGLGLGLYISYNIVKEHEGHIEVDSRAGKGTTFRVWLPASVND
jgi:signal transduction histidine kinase